MILSYSRVSTSEQAADGATSLAEQRRKNWAIAQLRGASAHDFAHYEDAGVSGSISLGLRPAGGEMLAAARSGDVVVANKLDRLFRSASDAMLTAEQLKKRGIDLILIDMGAEPVTGNGVAKLFFGLLALVAEFERERISERTIEGRAGKRRNGGHIGGQAPYGFKVVGEGRQAVLEPREDEQEVIRLTAKLWRELHARPHRVATRLNEMGVRLRGEKPVQATQVKRMLRNGQSQRGGEVLQSSGGSA
jgi:putative DNA-invertase from lambdoid prophage Rac